MREIYRSDYNVIAVDDERRLVRRTRTALPYPSFAEIGDIMEEMMRALGTLDRARHVQLADVRLGPPRNDAAFEQFIAPFTQQLYRGFRRCAILVKTHAGRLQFTRILNHGGYEHVQVHLDEVTAMAWLLSPSIPPRPPR
ncbi:hypothetical protein [Chondromyces apiculatus]|uniref:STAS/SEC14 domain-containing protein n=1 Tax=Chondromyces apiculatus DSM 436 TaxID=1192034 RepID=A0A017TFJ0_9BACT|nr:hypothetical protein [Chondromyces apiculatus]EYF07697.1 Hypothetical protein CAP_8198 [Chondromyces apiculatus DSM 436]